MEAISHRTGTCCSGKRAVPQTRGQESCPAVPVVNLRFLVMVFHFFTRAEKGIKLVQEGQYAQAVALFTEAINCDPEDYRYITRNDN